MKPINPLRERKKPGSLSQSELYAQVKDSTERNRQFFFIWIAFALYVIVTTVATTDLQLLLPNSTVTLPALGIQLPLIGFFLVTPWLVLILHFNLLQNLDSHANKLMQWANTYPNQTPPRAALPAFLFDFAMLEQGGVFAKLTQVAAQLVFYAAGPITIGILLWRFSDYQSWQYTVSQVSAFFSSIYLVVTASLALNRKHRLKVVFSEFNYWLVYVPIVVVVVLQTYWVLALASQTNKPWLFSQRYPEVFIPIISLPPYTTLVSFPADMQSRMALDNEKDPKEWWRNYGLGANLNGRNLKYAVLTNVDLRKVNLSNSRLQGANLVIAKLHGANLGDAQMRTANLNGAQLPEVYLGYAQLQEANIQHADLQGADLIGAKLQGANLTGAMLQRANLSETELQGAKLSRISVDIKTSFVYGKTDTETKVFELLGKPIPEALQFNSPIDMTKTFALRKKLRDENGLKLPDNLYEQLFATSTSFAMKNNTGQMETVIGVGLRVRPNK